jgi:hypothetical protein
MKVKFMPNVYVILGEADARKSSTIRALTGVGQLQPGWSVATTLPLGDIWVYVQIRSLQEEADITPDEFIKIITEHNEYRDKKTPKWDPVTNILIPLRISSCPNCPDGAGYLQHFAEAGWNIRQIVVLGATTLPAGLPAGVPTHLISDSSSRPANWIASQIRGWWSWL